MSAIDTLFGRRAVKTINPLLTPREVKQYQYLARSVDAMHWARQTRAQYVPGRLRKIRATLLWIFWLRRFDSVTQPFDTLLNGWFVYSDGKVPDELGAEVIRMTCRHRMKLVWLTRVQLAIASYSSIVLVLRLAHGSFHIPSLAGVLFGLVGAIISIGVRVQMTADLDMGTWWSVNDKNFAKVLKDSGGGFKLGMLLRISLGFINEDSGLGLTGNGYEIVRGLADQWELTFAELLETADSLSK